MRDPDATRPRHHRHGLRAPPLPPSGARPRALPRPQFTGHPRTLVTDRPSSRIAAHYFDAVVLLATPPRTDCRPKLDLDRYTPYRRTVYLDADSLVVRRLDPLFTLFQGHDFVVVGKNITSGHWYGGVTDMRCLSGSPSLPQFNGGFLYFTDTPRARRIFAQARHLAGTYDALGYDRFNRGITDEPLLAIALAAERLPAHDLTHTAMQRRSARPARSRSTC